ncbi:caspase family protein [Bradyrhizobium sp. SRS-191]|uniref:caspase family protein n=1 Tax=Bradyrhizobium sp. SRS-191 TaxID=2962606 RepID=UPI00211ECAD2|nr:caspase family protein [Bradyrhizobium sp. SRS-191]
MRRVIAQIGKVGCKVGQLLSAPLLVIVAILAFTGPAAADKRVALVIGNSIHEHAPLLDEPASDARLLAAKLTQLGFILSGGVAQIDLDKKGFDRALAEFKGRIADADLALIYYAGYGLNLNGTNYLVPVDAAPTTAADLERELRDLNAVLRELEGSNRRQNVVILDAFRANPFEPRGITGLTAGLSPARVPPRTLISFAAQPGTVGQRGPDGHGVFAAALAQALQQQDRRLVEVFGQTAQSVERLTNGAQQPFVMFTQIDGGAQTDAAAQRPAQPAAPTASQTTASPASPAAATAAQDARTPGLAVLYDEDVSDPKGKRYSGSVAWRLETVKTAGRPVPVIRAEIDIPDRKLRMSLQLRRNDDPSLPASHVAELTFSPGADFVGTAISNVPGILMKTEENARGTPLAGLAVKITEGSFLVGFSNVDADRARNEELLARREWFDIPVVYANQRRGILALGKGPSGDRVFADAFAAWSKYQPAK